MPLAEPPTIKPATDRLRFFAVCLACSLTASLSHADDRRLRECPTAVQSTILQNLLGGKVDEINEIRINDHSLFLVEIDLKGFKDAKLYISGDGTLRKALVEIRLQDLPEAVRLSLQRLVKRRGQINDIEKEIIEGKVRYRIEIEQQKQPDRTVTFEEDGSLSLDK